MTKSRNKKAFTIIELIVVIAIIGILVLLAAPKFLGYAAKAQLVRIQHDVKVMETIMEDELARNFNLNYNNFEQNKKDLEKLIVINKLFEKQGYAKNVEYVKKDGEFGDLIAFNSKFKNNNLAMGGPLVIPPNEIVETTTFTEGYKIIPEEYKSFYGFNLSSDATSEHERGN